MDDKKLQKMYLWHKVLLRRLTNFLKRFVRKLAAMCCHQRSRLTATQQAHNRSLWWSSQLRMRCPLLVSKMFFANTPPLLSISLRSCPNDDPRLTFNHYLNCPFNNYSTTLHNFNTRGKRWIPVIVNCLIDTLFFSQAVFLLLKL